jgi:hypothetical protein
LEKREGKGFVRDNPKSARRSIDFMEDLLVAGSLFGTEAGA